MTLNLISIGKMRQYRRVYLENKFAIGKDLFYYIFLQSLSLVYCIVYSDTIEHIQFFHQLWTHIIKKIYLFLHSIRFLSKFQLILSFYKFHTRLVKYYLYSRMNFMIYQWCMQGTMIYFLLNFIFLSFSFWDL